MSDPHISQDWEREVLVEIIGEADLSTEDIDEILNGHAEVVDRQPVSMDNASPYELLVERYGLTQQEAYRKTMDVLHEDLEYWTPKDQDPPLQVAEIIDFSHEVSTNYSRAEDGLEKQRSHYGSKHPETGEIIMHTFEDNYVEVESKDEK